MENIIWGQILDSHWLRVITWSGYWPLIDHIPGVRRGPSVLFSSYPPKFPSLDIPRITQPDHHHQLDQREASIQVTWSLSTNQRPVSRSHDHSRPIRCQHLCHSKPMRIQYPGHLLPMRSLVIAMSGFGFGFPSVADSGQRAGRQN